MSFPSGGGERLERAGWSPEKSGHGHKAAAKWPLERFANSQSDTEAALALQQAKRRLLGQVKAKQTA